MNDRLSRDPVFVTGASGFVGSAVVRALLREGYAVRALVRPSSPRTNLLGLPVDIVEGDITDKASLAKGFAGARFAVHVAADYRLWTRSPSQLHQSNVTGTSNVMRAAMDHGVEKIIYTSSVCTLAPSKTGDADETSPLPLEKAFNAYKRSKLIAERLVLDLVAREKLKAVIVNPSAPIGPRDVKPTPTGRIILECAAGRMPAYLDTGLNIAHVDDVAEGYIAALLYGKIGERYILGGENVRLAEFLTEICRQAGRRPPRIRLTESVVYPIAVISEGLAWLTGAEPFATVDGVRMARDYMFFSDGKARRELGYTSRPYEEGVADALAWFRSAGLLPTKTFHATASSSVPRA
jgi:dihydroflavonol-4-reductase